MTLINVFLFYYYRMKREVDSSLVERGVAERVRLTKGYDHKRDELMKQHEHVREALIQHRTEVCI